MKNAVLDFLRRMAVSNIYLYDFVRRKIGPLSFMLPHDEAFYGLASFGDGDDLFLDVGANDGISARSYRKLVKHRPIMSLEANPLHTASLEAARRDLANFSYRICAAGKTAGSLRLFTPRYKGVALTNYASMSEAAARDNLERHMKIPGIGRKAEFLDTKVDVIRIDDINVDPALVKIDVEGFEAEVVEGMLATLARARPVIMIEYNPRSFTRLNEMLSGLGFEARSFSRGSGFADFREAEPDLNVFFIPRGKRG